MCGIAGIVALDPSARSPEREALIRMASSILHRGPDELGIYRDARVGLAHSRLSIIDLATGQQPMSTEDDELHVVFNGEIFNYIELREELVARGHRFRTPSDTEVILHAYRAWGEKAFERFRGQFAIALWRPKDRTFVFARDRNGIRPLFLSEHAGRLYFASEVRAIFAADPSIPRAFDPLGLDETFTFWASIAPRSVFEGVTELRPAHVRTYSLETRSFEEHAYWQPRYPRPGTEGAFEGTLDDAIEAVREKLDEATELRMLRADVPVGSYLSGGLDSSMVAAMGRRAIGGRLKTFSLRFEDAEYDETRYQRMVAEQIESDHAEVVVSRRDIASVFPDTVLHTERPILRTAPAPLLLLSRLVRDAGIKVVLTGEGADEMFAGYDLFREGVVRRFWARQPSSTTRPRLLERLYPYLARSPVSQRAMAQKFFGRDLDKAGEPGFTHGTRWQSTAALKRLFSNDLREKTAGFDPIAGFLATLPPEFSDWSALGRDQYVEIRTLMSAYILSSQGDRMLMASSVEGRFPFLDAEVVDLANSLPPSYKLRVLDEKHVLKRVAEGLIPAEVIARQKQPYRAPDALSFAGADRPDYVDECLSERAVRDAGVFSPERVAQLWDKCRDRAEDGQFSNTDNMALVGILSTQLLHRQMVVELPRSNERAKLTTDRDTLASDR
jgi:asparagine synthase (glutamine-hydrolysing)